MTILRSHAFLSLLLVTACSSTDVDESNLPDGDELGTVVPPGKADNYFSTVAQEYTVTGSTTATIDQECVARNASAPNPTKTCSLEAITLKNLSIAWFLNQYVVNKHGGANEDWGGFTAMTRPGSYEALEVSAPDAEGKFTYTFTSELSGPLKLLSTIATVACEDQRCFSLEIPVLPNSTLSQLVTGNEWYRKAPFSAYDPAQYSGDKETLGLTIKPYPRSNDAYLEYSKLFDPSQLAKAGDALRIGIFVGWDYNDARFDLQTARELYRWLTQENGYVSPASDFEQMGIDSGDLTKTIKVKGRDVKVSVKLVHPGQGDPTNPTFAGQLKSAMIQAFSERQVVIYDGHAGPLYGFSLSDWNATETGELDDSELPSIPMPQGFYQIVLASGCDTYMVADSLFQNPVKQGRVDLDVITTTTFAAASAGGSTSKLLIQMVANDFNAGQLQPLTYGALLEAMNKNRQMSPPLFGVHGIDDNPRQNPFADLTKACQPCEANEDCGGYDSMCVRVGGQGHCALNCQVDDDCSDRYVCSQIAQGDSVVGKQCVPKDGSCD